MAPRVLALSSVADATAQLTAAMARVISSGSAVPLARHGAGSAYLSVVRDPAAAQRIRNNLLFRFRQLASELGQTPSGEEVARQYGWDVLRQYEKIFGSLIEATRVARLGLNPKVTDGELIRDLRALHRKIGRAPTVKDVDANLEMCSAQTYLLRFDRFETALERAGILEDAHKADRIKFESVVRRKNGVNVWATLKSSLAMTAQVDFLRRLWAVRIPSHEARAEPLPNKFILVALKKGTGPTARVHGVRILTMAELEVLKLGPNYTKLTFEVKDEIAADGERADSVRLTAAQGRGSLELAQDWFRDKITIKHPAEKVTLARALKSPLSGDFGEPLTMEGLKGYVATPGQDFVKRQLEIRHVVDPSIPLKPKQVVVVFRDQPSGRADDFEVLVGDEILARDLSDVKVGKLYMSLHKETNSYRIDRVAGQEGLEVGIAWLKGHGIAINGPVERALLSFRWKCQSNRTNDADKLTNRVLREFMTSEGLPGIQRLIGLETAVATLVTTPVEPARSGALIAYARDAEETTTMMGLRVVAGDKPSGVNKSYTQVSYRAFLESSQLVIGSIRGTGAIEWAIALLAHEGVAVEHPVERALLARELDFTLYTNQGEEALRLSDLRHYFSQYGSAGVVRLLRIKKALHPEIDVEGQDFLLVFLRKGKVGDANARVQGLRVLTADEARTAGIAQHVKIPLLQGQTPTSTARILERPTA